jgi:heat shock protein HslJ
MLDQRCAVRAGSLYILFALACTQPREAPIQRTVDAQALEGTDWIVSSLNGESPVQGSNITMNFERGTIGGYAGCNWYGSSYSITYTTVQFGPAERTARGCESPAGVSEQEEDFFRTLTRVTTIRMINDRLAMADGAGATVLLLTPRPRFAMNPADLVGTAWQLRAVNDTIQSDSALTLMIPREQEISGFAGCRRYTGTYEARGDEIRITSISMTATECARGQAALLREGRFTTNLSEASYFRLGGDSLELVTAPGHRLMFTRASLRAEDLTGDWEKMETTLPPIQLRIWLERDTLRARLRLSGSESTGTATIVGSELRLTLTGRGEQLTGTLVSPNELALRFSSGAPAYRLRRMN